MRDASHLASRANHAPTSTLFEEPNMKTLSITLAILLSATVAPSSYAQIQMNPPSAQVAPSATTMTDGEVRKIDKETKKITIKHGEIKNLDMPGMTMVFQVKDVALLDPVKVGDKVKFVAEKAGGAIVVTDIQPGNSLLAQ